MRKLYLFLHSRSETEISSNSSGRSKIRKLKELKNISQNSFAKYKSKHLPLHSRSETEIYHLESRIKAWQKDEKYL